MMRKIKYRMLKPFFYRGVQISIRKNVKSGEYEIKLPFTTFVLNREWRVIPGTTKDEVIAITKDVIDKREIKRVKEKKYNNQDRIVVDFLNSPPEERTTNHYFMVKRMVERLMYDMGLENFREYVIELTKNWWSGAKENRDENLRTIMALKI